MRTWKEFESLIADLQEKVAGDATVERDKKVRGRSGQLRQLDVTISRRIGLTPIFVVLECKDQKRPVNISQVEAFVTKLRDVRASQGILVSSSGFSAGAKGIAADHSIVLSSYRAAQTLDWKSLFKERSWSKFLIFYPKTLQARVIGVADIVDEVVGTEVLLGENGEPLELGSISDFANDMVRDSRLLQPVGDFMLEASFSAPVFIRTQSGLSQLARIVAEGENVVEEFAVNLEFATGHVLESDDGARITEVTTESFKWQDHIVPGSGRELTIEELQARQEEPGRKVLMGKDLQDLKPYLRLVVTKSEPGS